MKVGLASIFFLFVSVAGAARAVDLSEQVVTFKSGASTQQGLISAKVGAKKQTNLVVLVPGKPSIPGPFVVKSNKLTSSGTPTTFLVAARQYLNDDLTMTLIADCPTTRRVSLVLSGVATTVCDPSYQASSDRFKDLKAMIDGVKNKYPSIKKVWLMGHSFGTVTSYFSALPAQSSTPYFSGVIHASALDSAAGSKLAAPLKDANYNAITIPQLFVSYKDDPCVNSPYSYAAHIADVVKIPLLSVTGGGPFGTDYCGGVSGHSFTGKQADVMDAIRLQIEAGRFVDQTL
jgi:hypothetical protein